MALREAALSIRIPSDTKDAIEVAARQEGRSVANWVEQTLIKALREMGHLPSSEAPVVRPIEGKSMPKKGHKA